MRYGSADARAVGVGALVGAVAVFAGVAWDGSTTAVAASSVVAAVPTGLVVGLVSRSYGTELLEGGLAAVGGSALGVLVYGLARTALAASVPLAYRFDELFLVSVYGFWALVVVGPVTFFVGGLVASWTGSRARLGGQVGESGSGGP
jgi:hypothetical protein